MPAEADRARAAALAEKGLNTIQGLVGPLPDAAILLRKSYLSWHDDVERLLEQLGAADLATLQNARHRDIANDAVATDELARSILRERDRLIGQLQTLVEMPVTPAAEDAAVVSEEIQGRAGEIYRWFPDRRLGDGGYGQVFEAERIDGLHLAVKKVPLRGPATARWYADARLAEREIQVARRVSGDGGGHVLPLIDDTLTTDALWLIMPRAEGSLEDRLRQHGPLDEAATRELALHAAAGLRTLAEHSVVHRDIKPGNLLRWKDRWVLADLGVARILDVNQSTYTWTGTGTHEYWAPELFDHAPETVRSDLYALGCTLMAALTGAPPFAGTDLRDAHANELPAVPEVLDHALQRAILQLLAKDPSARPADARQLQQMLTARPRSSGQATLARLATDAARRASVDEQRDQASKRLHARRVSAQAAFEATWSDLALLAQEVVQDAEEAVRERTWRLQAAGGRLAVQLAEPSHSNTILWIGMIAVRVIDHSALSVVANLVCTHGAAGPEWQIIRFLPDFGTTEGVPVGPTRMPGPAGVSLSHLDRLLEQTDAVHPFAEIGEATHLTASSLLDLFVDEFAALMTGAARPEVGGPTVTD